MKTTLEIPDPTFRKAKAAAGALGIPLHEFVTQAVEEKLSMGGRRQELIDEEFEQIEPEN
jgi:hypothetical protein